jgi:hypothetical protein
LRITAEITKNTKPSDNSVQKYTVKYRIGYMINKNYYNFVRFINVVNIFFKSLKQKTQIKKEKQKRKKKKIQIHVLIIITTKEDVKWVMV